MFVVTDMDSCFCQGGIVERPESIEIFSINVGGPVASHQFVFKEDAHFGNNSCAVRMFGGSYFNRSNQVFFSVCTQCSDRELRTGKDDRLREVLKHETECRCRIRHCIGAM